MAAAAATSAPIRSVQALVAMSNEEAKGGLPAVVEGIVTYYNPSEDTLFINENGIGVYVDATTDPALAPGDRVRVTGTTQSSGFRPSLASTDIVLLGHGALPRPVPATFDELIQARRDSTLVTLRGVARTADMLAQYDFRGGGRPMHQSAHIQLLTDGGYVEALVDTTDAAAVEDLLDAEVQVSGVAAGVFNGKYHLTGVCLYVSSLDNIRVIRKAASSPWSLPITPMSEIIHTLHKTDLSGRVRVHGAITYYRPGTAVVLQQGSESVWIGTETNKPLRVGDLADAVGFPDGRSKLLSLDNAEVEDEGVYAPVEPRKVQWAELASSRSVFDLVSIEGVVVSEVGEPAQDEYVLRTDGELLSAFFRDGAETTQSHQGTMKNIAEGSTVRVTGICIPDDSSPSSTNLPFSLLMRSTDDITVVAMPAWLNARHVAESVGLLLFAVLCFLARMWVVERRVRRQIASLAYAESRRSKILVDINNSRPLAEILERVTELVSARLNGAPCWCEVANGARLGNPPSKLGTKALRVVEQAIPARSGPPLGTLYAAFDANARPRREEAEALAMAAGLATLAIETERLYSDLVHRSRFDQLTDIENRFSFERRLEEAIHAARQSAGIFGLLYIDLNDFKQVNDVYGHRVGDLYLKEAASRMIKQLRPGDCLARLGGDEFAVVLPDVHSREAVEEIARRLEACYDEPYEGEGRLVRGSASIGIAMYPDDAATGDGLLSAADAAMYFDKQTRSRRGSGSGGQRDKEMSSENLM